jgi:hypothetical protein
MHERIHDLIVTDPPLRIKRLGVQLSPVNRYCEPKLDSLLTLICLAAIEVRIQASCVAQSFLSEQSLHEHVTGKIVARDH